MVMEGQRRGDSPCKYNGKHVVTRQTAKEPWESRQTAQEQRQKRQLAQRARQKRRAERIRRICLAVGILGLALAAAFWHDHVKNPVSAKDIRAEADGYPDSLLKLMEMNPEAEAFVKGYFENRDKHPEIDLSDVVEQGTIPLFLQWDERWGYETYGSDFLAITGCGPTCLSMVWCGLSGKTDWDPLRMAQFAEEEGYYVKGKGTAWKLMTHGAEQLGLTAQEITFSESSILACLKNGIPIICAMRPGDFTTTGHFIVLSGLDEAGQVTVRDPNSISNSDKSWNISDLMPQIKNLWGYQYEP